LSTRKLAAILTIEREFGIFGEPGKRRPHVLRFVDVACETALPT